MLSRMWAICALSALGAFAPIEGKAESKPFVAFESGQVRPMAMSPDGNSLYVVNTPDNRLEVFSITETGLVPVASVPVGMEPVAVAARNDQEVWVVNHLSDSVSIVRRNGSAFTVARTLSVGDEPTDIVFAGPGKGRAFIAAARRDLRGASAKKLGKADVYVFNANNPGLPMGGSPLAVVNLFAESPRALAVSANGESVYAAAFRSGNKTTVISPTQSRFQVPPPGANVDGVPAPATGYVVQYDGAKWVDGTGQNWSARLNGMSMPDVDVFRIDASADAPQITARFAGVGTVLYNMAVNPVTGRVYVSNTEARNVVRFEGHGVVGGSTVRGHFAENRITVLSGSSVLPPRHLNKHINFDTFDNAAVENPKSLAIPLEMVVSTDGRTLYVAAFGSSKVGIFNTAELEANTFQPSEDDHITVGGGGPSGLVLDEARNRLYVLTRFDNAVSVVDLVAKAEVGRVAMFNPEPPSITLGRRFLYDARYTSSRGDSACASCHLFGDHDGLAWDLGDPDGAVVENPNPIKAVLSSVDTAFHPMKGPMLTQSLRGMATHGPLHWRGDRTGGKVDDNGNVVGDPMDEAAAFTAFNVAFEGLLGRSGPLTDAEMAAFTDFALQLSYQPNPNRAIDASLNEAQTRGRDFFFTQTHSRLGNHTCNECHVLDPASGFFGTDGMSVMLENAQQIVKTPHLRNLYTRIANAENVKQRRGQQLTGFGFGHAGNSASLLRFFSGEAFEFPGGDAQRMDVIAFVLAFDSDLAPAVGQQVTLAPGATENAAIARIAVLTEQAGTSPEPACDLIVKGRDDTAQRGWLRLPSGVYRSDRRREALYSFDDLKQIARGGTTGQAGPLTFTCVPPGSGVRLGLDRDGDGVYDRDEVETGRNPAVPES